MIFDLVRRMKFTHIGLWLSYNQRKKQRSHLIQKQPQSNQVDSSLLKFKQLGYSNFKFHNDTIVRGALETLKKKYSPEIVLSDHQKKGGKGPFASMRIDPADLQKEPLSKLFQSDEILINVREYFGCTPILNYAAVWFSPNNFNDSFYSSQLFHFDREDYRQIKCFIPIEKIDSESGPLSVIDAQESAKFVRSQWKRLKIPSSKDRYDDASVRKCTNFNIVQMTGDAGELILVDTTRCLHFGSRNAKKPKYHLTLQYLTPFSPKFDNREHLLQEACDDDLGMLSV